MEQMNVKTMLSIIILGIMCVSNSINPTWAKTDGNCWNNINKCVLDHVGRSLVEPKFNPMSPSFNMTEFLCCPLIEEAAQTDKECFCVIDTLAHQNPSLASNVTNVLSLCSIVDSVAALDNFCLGIASTPAEAPLIPLAEAPMMPVLPPL